MVSSIAIKHQEFNITSIIYLHAVKWWNDSIWTTERSVSGTATPGQRWHESNVNERLLHIPPIFQTENSPLDVVYCYSPDTSHIWFVDRTLTGTTSSSQNASGSNGNEGIVHIPQISRTADSLSGEVYNYTLDNSFIWLLHGTLTGTTSSSQSARGSNVIEGVLHIFQYSKFTLLVCLTEMQSVYSVILVLI